VIYLDTSLLLPVYVPEAQSQTANEILESDGALYVSDVTVAEFLVGLARKVKLEELTPDQAAGARALFEQHLRDGLLVRVAAHALQSEEAGQLAFRSTVLLRALDALHLSWAMKLEATLATFDRRLSEAARAFGLNVLP
jgi:predicted nucleic acid-binding protein